MHKVTSLGDDVGDYDDLDDDNDDDDDFDDDDDHLSKEGWS